ncbi:MAG: T9SS type A sorting domain-containing protein [Bacteroidales bacterium]|nr:T9SS type A sorting domain-containing protein [Bacteroidales bacterium]MCF8388041.1 T9SS type A sorting domain-containing protein [Bacteroidales bacterium]MCF8397058.1 T9SS type A sorting domain-containing protein [Bacteroidales bacterium]
MNRRITLLMALTMMVSFVFAQRTTYDNSWGKHGISLKKATNSKVTINYSVHEFSLLDTDVRGEAMKTPVMPGQFLPGDEGAPNLPGNGRYIAVPEGATAKVNIKSMRKEIIQDVEIAPAPAIPKDTDQSPLKLEKNTEIYSKNAFYPESYVKISEPLQIRGVDAVMLGITPWQYNPVTKELVVYRDIEIEVIFEGGTAQFGEERLRSRYFDKILYDAFLNASSLPEIDYSKNLMNKRSEDGCEYLIVSPDGAEFQQWADSIKLFRIQQGILTDVVTISEIGGNNAVTLENYFDNAYNTWDIPPAAVLLLGDYGSDPNTNITSPIYDNYCVSDNIYADVDDDHMPDMVFARITANNNSQLETMVTKFLNHERTPPTNPDFYDHPITALGWQTERWFQICSESVGGFFKHIHGKDPNRVNEIYQGTPGDTWSTAQNTSTVVDYFGPNGLGYIPAAPSALGGWSGGTAADINNGINSGAFILQHRDHGSTTGWGEPDYDMNDIDGCQNTDLTFIFSINCLTGKYNISGECFTEKFHRYTYNGQNSGALGLIAASETSYSFVNDTYVWGMYDNMWPEFMPDYGTWFDSAQMRPAFGNAAGKYFLQQSNWPYNTSNKEVTYHLFHHHGGAFLTLYSEVPQDVELLHDGVILSGLTEYTVQATEGAFIALTRGEQILGTGTGQGMGNPVNISIPPQPEGVNVLMTITKPNYYRYTETIPVISADNPYCKYESHRIDDSEGNGNSKIDFGETISTSIVIENLGNVDTENAEVSMTTNDPFVTMLDDNEYYGVIPANDTLSVHNGFKFEVAGDIPDEHRIEFEIIVTDDSDESWNSLCYMEAAAPVLRIGDLIIDDSEGGNGNGKLDPGESVDLIVKNYNDGHCLAHNSIASMETTCQYINLLNTTDTLGTVGFFGASNAVFSVEVDPDAPNGSIIVNFNYELVSNDITLNKLYKRKIGSIIEDWETGDFEKFPWEHDGDASWEIISQYPYEGFFSARTPEINSGQTAELLIQWEVMYGDSIRFVRKVSSAESNKLKFYIGNTMKGSWSGTGQGWTEEAYYVSPGWRTFKFIYDKPSGTVVGSDCAWLDMIELPSEMTLTANAGQDALSCMGDNYQCDGNATDYESVEWSTSGTGTFDDINILDPLYTPSQEDFDNGSVMLTLTAIDTEGETQEDEMTLTFIDAPVAPGMPEGPDEVDVLTTYTSEYFIEPVEYADSYAWAIEPAEAGSIEGNGLTGTVSWNSDFMGIATITARGINECGEGNWSEGFEVNVYNTVAIDEKINGLNINVFPNPSTGMFNISLKSDKAQTLDVTVYSIIGSVVYKMEDIEVFDEFNTTFDMDKHPEGLYFLNIKGQDIEFNKKMIIQK